MKKKEKNTVRLIPATIRQTTQCTRPDSSTPIRRSRDRGEGSNGAGLVGSEPTGRTKSFSLAPYSCLSVCPLLHPRIEWSCEPMRAAAAGWRCIRHPCPKRKKRKEKGSKEQT